MSEVTEVTQFLIRHGLPLVFAVVLVEQMGMPIPALPFLLAAGALSHDRDIVVYCSCPDEATAAKVALLLQRRGFTRVRPLLGGIAAWREGNHPMEAWAQTPALAL